MPPRAARSRNSNYEAPNSQFLEQSQVPEGMGESQLMPMGASSSGQQQGDSQPYPSTEPQFHNPIVVDRPFIPDIPVSLLDDPQCKMLLKGSLTKLAKEAAPGVKLEDDAAELLLYVANDFLSSLANFSCRLASHRGGENLDARDVELYLERMHGMHISLAASPPPLDPPGTPSEGLTPPPAPAPTRKREPSASLAQTRPRRHTNAAPPEEDEEDEDEDEEGEDGTEGGDNAEEGESDEEKPRESRRLRERAIAAEKQVKKGKRGKAGRPKK